MCLVLTTSRLEQSEKKKPDSYLAQFAFTEITEFHHLANYLLLLKPIS